MNQRTLAAPLTIAGIGVHSGATATLHLLPAPVDTGIYFVRVDVTDQPNRIPARWDCVVDTRMCTVLANTAGVSVATVEHLMAALRGCDVTNVIIEIDGPEIPIMDGSSAPFITAIDAVGTTQQSAPVYAIKVLKPVRVQDGDKVVTLAPAQTASYEGDIDFDHQSIGCQSYRMTLLNGNFRHELSSARTFGFFDDVEALRKMGLARGGSLDNAIVIDRDGVMNPGGLRFDDEFIRHKLLDAVGDMYLAGAPMIAAYTARKPSHALNNALLRELFAHKDAWAIVPMDVAARELEAA